MNILIDGHDLGVLGGIERFVCDLASAMAQRGHAVTIFISEPLPQRPLYTVDAAVRFSHYSHNGRQGHLAAFRQQVLDLHPDVCISPAGDRRHFPWCYALAGSGIPLIISEHSTPEDVEARLWNREERLAVMDFAAWVHFLRSSCLASVPEEMQRKAIVIPNAVNIPLLAPQCHSAPTILSMGRLDKDKQNALLVDAFALVVQDFPEWRLEIWGLGVEQGNLTRQIESLHLGSRAFLRGLTTNPERQYAAADLLCLPSRHEAFPGAVVEAMTAGLPVVGFAACPGTNELVQQGLTGLLAEEMSAESLAHSLRQLMGDADLRKRMGRAAQEAAQTFAPDKVYAQWESMLLKTAPPPASGVQPMSPLLVRCLARPNLLVGDGQLLRRIVFAFPWLKRMLHPLYRRCKSLLY